MQCLRKSCKSENILQFPLGIIKFKGISRLADKCVCQKCGEQWREMGNIPAGLGKVEDSIELFIKGNKNE